MILTETPAQSLKVAKGQDLTFLFRVRSHESCQLADDAAPAAVLLYVRPLPFALASGDKLLFGENYVVTVSNAANAGDITLAVTALDGPLRAGETGQMLRDLTGFTVAMEVATRRGDADAVITLAGVVATQTASERGNVAVALLAASTANVAAGAYYWSLWRTNAGGARPLAEGDFEIAEMGML